MRQLSIFDVFDDLEKEYRILEVLDKAKEYDPKIAVAAVYIPSPDMSAACCSFVGKNENVYKYFMILHGRVVDRSHPLIDMSPARLNKHWMILN